MSYAQSSLNASIEIYDVTTGLLVNNTQPLNSSSRLVTDSAGIGLYAFLPDNYSVKKYQFENNTLNLTGFSNNTSSDYWGRYGWASPDGKYLVLDSGHILNTKDFSLYLKLSSANSGAIRSVAFTSNSQINVLTEYSGVRKIDLATGTDLSNTTCMRCLSIFSLNNELFYIGDGVSGYQITGKL
ncbi:MAG: hypothetical protein EOO68_27620 [Moraxellaceae bacterium]|nr:MAG: hypothetical protein EOO68_27620 [Moraxellaceae bacterium]